MANLLLWLVLTHVAQPILPMFFNLSRHSRLIRRGFKVGAKGLLIGSLVVSAGATSAIAQISAPNREQPPLTLRELLELLNNRPAAPTVTDPAAETVPSSTTPQPEAEAAPALEQAISLRLDLSDRKVYVQRGDTVEASFPVAVGKPGWETPTGEFEVFSQIVEPGWTSPFDDAVVAPGPGGPLGDRWIGFWTDGTDDIGFHGTPTRESVGTAASHGCVRMYNEDIRQMFDMVAMGTPVIVEP